MRFADEVAERRGLDPAWVRGALAEARFVPSVDALIMPPPAGTAKNWAAYRARFVEPIRIRAGVAFWRANERWLAEAEELYGVPPEIVVGIVGVESIYGRQMGDFRVIDALATLAFDFPSGRKDRSDFFRDELENWFVLCNSEGIDPLAWRGSYAGAIGMAQFMPSSFNRYAVDFDGDGHVDLHASAADVIGSVANYLAEFGWKRGLPTRFEVRPPTDDERARRAARARHRADLHAPPRWPRAAPCSAAMRSRCDEPAGARRAAERRRRAELRRRHDQLLRGDALQLVELLRDGGDRARRGGAARSRAAEPAARPAQRASIPSRASASSPCGSSLRARRGRAQLPARIEPARVRGRSGDANLSTATAAGSAIGASWRALSWRGRQCPGAPVAAAIPPTAGTSGAARPRRPPRRGAPSPLAAG